MTHELNVPGITVWAGICSDGLIGPFFFDGTVKAQSYLEILQQQFLPAAENLVNLSEFHFQQDGALPRYGLIVKQWLNNKFSDRWLGCRSPIEWQALSPDLTPLDFFLWGHLKN